MRSLMELLKEEDNAINAIVRIDEREQACVKELEEVMANPHECMAKENDIERLNVTLRTYHNQRVAAEQNLNDARQAIADRLRSIMYADVTTGA